MNVLELASDTSPLLHACVSLLFKMGTASWMNLIGLSIICEHCYCAWNMGSFISKFMFIILHFSYTVPKDSSFRASSVLNTSPHRKKKPLNCLPKNLITTVSLKHSFAWWTRHCWHPQFSSWFSSATTTDFQRNKRNRRCPSPLLNLNGAGVRVENCLLPLYVRNLHEWLQILGNVSSKGRIVGAIMSGNTARMKESLLLFLKQLWFSQNEMW